MAFYSLRGSDVVLLVGEMVVQRMSDIMLHSDGEVMLAALVSGLLSALTFEWPL